MHARPNSKKLKWLIMIDGMPFDSRGCVLVYIINSSNRLPTFSLPKKNGTKTIPIPSLMKNSPSFTRSRLIFHKACRRGIASLVVTPNTYRQETRAYRKYILIFLCSPPNPGHEKYKRGIIYRGGMFRALIFTDGSSMDKKFVGECYSDWTGQSDGH